MCAKNLASNKSLGWRDEVLTLRDGIDLTARIWSPKGSGPWPALLMRQPYGREIASTLTYCHPSWWASHGFLVVVQDVRGQGDSQGVFAGFNQESSDTTQTHAWVRSLPECNGKLGTYGFSYQGLTQLIAETGTHPPDCLAPAMTGIDEKEHWSCDGGAYWWHLGLSWGLQLAALKKRRDQDWGAWEEIRLSIENGNYLREGASLLEKHDPNGMELRWLKLSNLTSNQNWTCHKPLKNWLKQPMLLIGGWWDPHLKGMLEIYKLSKASGGSPDLHIGPATHLEWWQEVQELHLNFFKKYLLETTVHKKESPTKNLWNLTSKTWQKSSELNDNKTSITPIWSLKTNGLACINPSEGMLDENKKGHGSFSLVHDPWRPVPSRGGHLSTNPGPTERGDLDNRPDVAVFTTQPLKRFLQLKGFPKLLVTAHSHQTSFDLCVALSVVDPEQRKVNQLSTGFARIQHEALKPIQREVLLQPIFADIKPEEHLRISIAAAAWPAIGVNPGHEGSSCEAPGPHCNVVTIEFVLVNSSLEIKPFP